MSKKKQDSGWRPEEEIAEYIMLMGKEVFSLISFIAEPLLGSISNKLSLKFPSLQRFIEPKYKPITRKDTGYKHVPFYIPGIGISQYGEVNWSEVDTSHHTLVVGASGCGKTNLLELLYARKMKEENSVVVFDPKNSREHLETFIKAAKCYRKKTYIVSPLIKEYSRFNPFISSDVTQVCEQVLTSMDKTENEFYKAVEKSYLLQSLEDILEEEKKAEKDKLILSFKTITERYLQNSDKEKNVMGLATKLENFAKSEISKFFEASDKALNFNKIREEGAAIYFGFPTLDHSEVAVTMYKMLIVSLMHYCGKVNQYDPALKRSLKPMSVFIDEANSLLFSQFYELVSKARSSKVELTTVVQSLSDFDLINPHIGRQVRENSKLHFYMRQTEESSTNIIVGNLSTQLTTKITRQMDNNSPTELSSVRDVHEFNLHPNVLKHLKMGQTIMRTAGERKLHALHLKKQEWIETTDGFTFVSYDPYKKASDEVKEVRENEPLGEEYALSE